MSAYIPNTNLKLVIKINSLWIVLATHIKQVIFIELSITNMKRCDQTRARYTMSL